MRNTYDTNRSVSQKCNNKGHWCNTCDAYIIHIGQKCPQCGKRDNKKKLKPTRHNPPDLDYDNEGP